MPTVAAPVAFRPPPPGRDGGCFRAHAAAPEPLEYDDSGDCMRGLPGSVTGTITRCALIVAVLVVATGCRSTDVTAPLAGAAPAVPGPAFSFATDTFAFPNLVRAHHPGRDDLYANYCFVLARGLRQFHAFARFDPGAPRLSPDGYAARVREIAARAPWEPAAAPEDRLVIPGYANLREFSRAEEAAVKAGLGSRLWTVLHWTNWRVTMPVTRAHQTNVAREILEELAAGRLVQLLVTNWPKPELNHTVVAYAHRGVPAGVELVVWDPNDPDRPGAITFDTAAGRFRATRLFDTEPGAIRAFRMYHSWLL